MPDVFISYSSHDRLQALSLAEKLRASGYDAWIDQHHIHGANRWGKEIVQAITSSQLVAVLISSSSVLSENVIKELNLAAQKHKHLLPIMIDDTELTEEFAYHLTGLHQVAIEDSVSILKALEQLQIRTAENRTPERLNARTPVPASKDIRLAVLPFDDLSREHDNEWFADGMLDELITTLGALENMKVPSRTDVMYYKRHHPKAQEIASDLNVRYLVGGSVRKAGEKIRITSSLTDAFTNQQLWTAHYDGSFDDIFELQERVSKEITETLKLRLTPKDKEIIAEQPTVNAEAYELWLKGNAMHNKTTRTAYERAIKFYEEAINLDPKFIDAYLQMARTIVVYYRECSRDLKLLEKAESNLQKAIKLGGESAKTLWITGEIAWQKRNYDEAEKILLLAAALDSNDSDILNMLGNVYLESGKIHEAVSAFENALKISPNNRHYFNFLVSLSILNDSEKIKERAKDALPILEKHVKYHPDDYFYRVGYAYTLHWAERNEDALREADILSSEDLDGMTLYNLGGLYDLLGMPEKNIAILRHAIRKGFREIETVRDGKFDNPQYQEEFQELILELETIIKQENESSPSIEKI